MDYRDQGAWVAVTLGAVVGGAVAYLLFTDGGRRIRAQFEPRIADLMRELDRWGAVDHLKRLALGGRAGAGSGSWGGEHGGDSLH